MTRLADLAASGPHVLVPERRTEVRSLSVNRGLALTARFALVSFVLVLALMVWANGGLPDNLFGAIGMTIPAAFVAVFGGIVGAFLYFGLGVKDTMTPQQFARLFLLRDGVLRVYLSEPIEGRGHIDLLAASPEMIEQESIPASGEARFEVRPSRYGLYGGAEVFTVVNGRVIVLAREAYATTDDLMPLAHDLRQLVEAAESGPALVPMATPLASPASLSPEAEKGFSL